LKKSFSFFDKENMIQSRKFELKQMICTK